MIVRKTKYRRRKGTITVLVLLMLVALLAVGAVVINWSLIQTTRAELRAATDATAKAALISLSLTQDEAEARRLAKEIAAENFVNGKPFVIADNEIQFGRSVQDKNGFNFKENERPFNSCRVLGTSKNSALLPGFLSIEQFSVHQQSIAHGVDNDVCIVLDRSGSMGWDMSGAEFEYPGSLARIARLQAYFEPPHPSLSRWAALVAGVDEFLQVLDDLDDSTRVAACTFASDFSFGLYESRVATVESRLSSKYKTIRSRLRKVGKQPVIGDTNIGAGLSVAISLLDSKAKNSRDAAQKTIVIFTDGIKTEGPDPVSLAAEFEEKGGRVHTITYSRGADQKLMKRVAKSGNGIHLHANTPEELVEAFNLIATRIPTVLIDDE